MLFLNFCHLKCGILARGNTYPSYLVKLNKLQNKAIRIVICSGCNDSALPLFKKIIVLTLSLSFQYETAKLVHRHSSMNLPVNLSNYFILSKNLIQLDLAPTKTYRRRYLDCKEPKSLSNLPVLKFGILSQVA